MIRSTLFAVLVAGCSNVVSPVPKQGRTTVQPNSIYFWKVNTSTVEWGACSDDARFREGAKPLPIGQNSFVMYKTDAEGKKATTQSCGALDPTTCKEAMNPVVFEVAGTEMTFSRPAQKEYLRVKDSLGNERDSKCQLSQLETWSLRDQGTSFEMEVNTSYDLEDTMPPSGECQDIEASLIKRSPNMTGIRGCIITYKLTGELR